MPESFYRFKDKDLVLELHIQTKASKDALIGVHNNRIKIAIAKAPEAGKANNHLVKWIASRLKVKQTDVQIIRGYTSKYKTVLITGGDIKPLLRLLKLGE
jgi:uncharacterized protein